MLTQRRTQLKVTVYLPDELGQQARDHRIPLSPTCRRAIEDAVAVAATDPPDFEEVTALLRGWLRAGHRLMRVLEDAYG
jgi:post-segregation antitoxin (ccd killing protein)